MNSTLFMSTFSKVSINDRFLLHSLQVSMQQQGNFPGQPGQSGNNSLHQFQSCVRHGQVAANNGDANYQSSSGAAAGGMWQQQQQQGYNAAAGGGGGGQQMANNFMTANVSASGFQYGGQPQSMQQWQQEQQQQQQQHWGGWQQQQQSGNLPQMKPNESYQRTFDYVQQCQSWNGNQPNSSSNNNSS